ncbi:hypothetical protein CesoFtcFv8_008511 [Champsocephalus esox]|uniref:Uncharacterized protein n=1 Tax=Champsocephalus esox TaxID=159716 RepID=A0AAN8H205_9TELE|nr:hypothetical protein CesoFtcFv8_008511 [Champsocephalus esox]
MLRTFFLLLFFYEGTVQSTTTEWPTTTTTAITTSLKTSTPRMTTEVAEKLGIAAFVFFLLALIVLFGILFWLGFQRLVASKTTSKTAAKGFPGTDKSPKGGFPPAESGGDVYMNYTGNDYSNLDLTNETGNDYSSLS